METLEEHIREESKSAEYLNAPIITESELYGSENKSPYLPLGQHYFKSINRWELDLKSKHAYLKIHPIFVKSKTRSASAALKSSYNQYINVYTSYNVSPLKQDFLKNFHQAVEEGKWMLDLEEGWDDMEALVISKELFNSATYRIQEYLTVVYNETAEVIKTPQINPVPDGSIDFQWSLNNVRLLINVKNTKEGILAYYYGDVDQKDLSIKGHVPLDANYEHLSKWMKFLLRG